MGRYPPPARHEWKEPSRGSLAAAGGIAINKALADRRQGDLADVREVHGGQAGQGRRTVFCRTLGTAHRTGRVVGAFEKSAAQRLASSEAVGEADAQTLGSPAGCGRPCS